MPSGSYSCNGTGTSTLTGLPHRVCNDSSRCPLSVLLSESIRERSPSEILQASKTFETFWILIARTSNGRCSAALDFFFRFLRVGSRSALRFTIVNFCACWSTMYTAKEAVLPLWALPNSVDANVETFNRRDAGSFWKPPENWDENCLLYTSPSPRDGLLSRMPSSA